MVLDAMLPISPEIVKADRILLRVHDCEQLVFEFHQLPGIHLAFEDGILDPLPVVETGFGDFTQSGPAGRGGGGDIVGDEGVHCSRDQDYLERKAG